MFTELNKCNANKENLKIDFRQIEFEYINSALYAFE